MTFLGLALAACVAAAAPAAAAPAALRHVYTGDFISAERQQGAGIIVDATADSLLLRPGDRVTLRYPKAAPVQVGDRLYSFASAQPISHPRSQQLMGYLTETTGVLEVREVAGSYVEANVVSSVAEVERGQWAVPLTGPLFIDVPTHPPKVAAQGEVMAVAHKLLMGSEQRLIYLDQGATAGLAVGDLLQVAGRRDTIHAPAPRPQRQSPVAQVVVVATRSHTATAFVVDALWEVAVGDAFVATP